MRSVVVPISGQYALVTTGRYAIARICAYSLRHFRNSQPCCFWVVEGGCDCVSVVICLADRSCSLLGLDRMTNHPPHHITFSICRSVLPYLAQACSTCIIGVSPLFLLPPPPRPPSLALFLLSSVSRALGLQVRGESAACLFWPVSAGSNIAFEPHRTYRVWGSSVCVLSLCT